MSRNRRSASLTPLHLPERKISLVFTSLDREAYISRYDLTYVLFDVHRNLFRHHSDLPLSRSYSVFQGNVRALHNETFAGLEPGVFWYFALTGGEPGRYAYCSDAQH